MFFFYSPNFYTNFRDCQQSQKSDGGSEICKDCLSTWLVQETCFFARLALILLSVLFLMPRLRAKDEKGIR